MFDRWYRIAGASASALPGHGVCGAIGCGADKGLYSPTLLINP